MVRSGAVVNLDWNVFARQHTAFVVLFGAFVLLLDKDESARRVYFGSPNTSFESVWLDFYGINYE